MLIVVSPAKTLDYESELPTLKTTQPRLLDDSEVLIERARQLSPADVSSLMKVSDKIAHLNVERFAQWQRPFNKQNARPAAFAFKGDVYTGLEIETFTDNQLKEAQQSFRMLSGLYGVLRPLDLMQPYRLEMGTKLVNPRGKDLYTFWGERISQWLNEDLEAQGDQVLLNLASQEYFGAVKPKALTARVIDTVFKDQKNGQYKIISFYAKKARGLMARYVIKERLQDPEGLKDFNLDGYRFDAVSSSENQLVFLRDEQA